MLRPRPAPAWSTAKLRDRMRTFHKARGYRMGYVTVDASDWAIDAQLLNLLQMYVQRGWRIIDAETAFQDPL